MPWYTRDEIRKVSAEAQRIHDDIAEGRLIIHLHAADDHTSVAVGSCTTGVRRHVHLHGENHLRQISTSYDGAAEAVAGFHRLYSVAVRPGPAPLTDLEQTRPPPRTGPGTRHPNAGVRGARPGARERSAPPGSPGGALLRHATDVSRWPACTSSRRRRCC